MTSDMKFFGSVTLGERGQIVVPADARDALGIKPGDKLLVFKAPVEGAVVVVKPKQFEKHVQRMNQRAAELQKELDQENKE